MRWPLVFQAFACTANYRLGKVKVSNGIAAHICSLSCLGAKELARKMVQSDEAQFKQSGALNEHSLNAIILAGSVLIISSTCRIGCSIKSDYLYVFSFYKVCRSCLHMNF